MKLVKQLFPLITCMMFLLVIAINKEGKVLNYPVEDMFNKSRNEQADSWLTNDGYNVISTHNIAKDIFGFAGNIPLHVYIKDNTIEKVEIQKNSETPEFLSSVVEKGLLNNWKGLTPEEASAKKVDAVTGATLSSSAIIESMDRAVKYASDNSLTVKKTSRFKWNDIKFLCVLSVVIAAMILPLFYKNKRYRTVQLFINMVVLGFWSGSFISLSLLVNFFANGINIWVSVIPVLLLISAFIYPLTGKKSHYCTWICPMGSCQELLGKSVSYKIKLKPQTIKYLDLFREILWLVIMGSMWAAIGFKLMNYELFSAFLFNQASWPIIIAAILVALMSCFIQRPYCRFVCPTGTLLKYSQKTGK